MNEIYVQFVFKITLILFYVYLFIVCNNIVFVFVEKCLFPGGGGAGEREGREQSYIMKVDLYDPCNRFYLITLFVTISP